MFNLIVDNEIGLRTFHPDDAEEFFNLVERNRPRLRPWINPETLPGTAKAARIFTIECFFYFRDNSSETWALFDQYFPELDGNFLSPRPATEMGIWYNDNLVGQVTLSRLSDSYTAAEFGYWITAEHEGKGIITRCVSALMDYAIENMKIERFVIGCALSNLPSCGIPLRLGYRLHATIPNGEVVGEFIYDLVIYGIRSNSWRERKK